MHENTLTEDVRSLLEQVATCRVEQGSIDGAEALSVDVLDNDGCLERSLLVTAIDGRIEVSREG